MLDRLPPFQHRLRVDAPFQPTPGVSTTSPPGACHMGRAADIPATTIAPGAAQEACWRVAETDAYVDMVCDPGATKKQLAKKPIMTPLEMVQQNMHKRQRCADQCTAPPPHVVVQGAAASSSGAAAGTVHALPVAEVGYGRPFRWEAARVIAGDLRFLLCGNATECPHIAASEWTLTNFLNAYFTAPERLVVGSSPDAAVRAATKTLQQILADRAATKPASQNAQAFEKAMWEDNPWVVCNDKKGTCNRTISKAEWLADRGGACTREVVAHLAENPGELAVEMDLCNLNSQMDSLCKSILARVLQITNINCRSAGNDVCLEKSFFYSPSTFSASNQQVRHQYFAATL